MGTDIQIRRLTGDDLLFADRVREQAGWNQTLADWRRLLALDPQGCFLAELDGTAAGTATTTVYGGSDLAWIGMVLVDEAMRRRGVGKALLNHCIDDLRERRQVGCIKLDATPAGQPLYEKLGFVAEWGLQRWVLETDACGRGETPARQVDEISDAALELDRISFGADRSDLLDSLAAGATAVKCAGSAYGILRPGSRASYLGPVVAATWTEAMPIVEDLVESAPAGGIFWDIPDHSEQAVSFARQRGFQPQRQLVRMVLNGETLNEKPQRVFAIAEPALG